MHTPQLFMHHTLDGLGTVAYLQKDFETARTYYGQSLSIAENIGNILLQHVIHKHLGFVEVADGNYHAARERFYTVLAKHKQYDTLQFHTLIDVAVGIAFLAAHTGSVESALTLLYFTSPLTGFGKHLRNDQELLVKLEAELPSDVVAAAKVRADQLSLEDVEAMLWDELGIEEPLPVSSKTPVKQP